MIFGVIIFFTILGWLVSVRLKNRMEHYTKLSLEAGMSGIQAAEQMLADNDIADVKVTCITEKLTDHYNPVEKTINLSEVIYHGKNVAAVAVATHECGHAIQHARVNSMLKLKSTKLVPVQVTAIKLLHVLMILGFLGIVTNWVPYFWVGLFICGVYVGITLISIITLPAEFDARVQALKWIEENEIVLQNEYAILKDALWWTAMTYLVTAIGALSAFFYYLTQFVTNRD